jgi:ribonuclease-3
VTELETRIGYTFRDPRLLRTALTHTSYANEMQAESYERLEFLGDSILGAVTAYFLYSHEPNLPEGRMTRLRAELVCEESLFRTAQQLDLGRYVLLGKGEEHTNGRERPSILADLVEAILAAIFLDGGMEPARRFVLTHVLKDVDLSRSHRTSDYKTELQELVQQEAGATIRYQLLDETGPDHCKSFHYAVFVNGENCGEGVGRTKKEAEQEAAGAALRSLRNE